MSSRRVLQTVTHIWNISSPFRTIFALLMFIGLKDSITCLTPLNFIWMKLIKLWTGSVAFELVKDILIFIKSRSFASNASFAVLIICDYEFLLVCLLNAHVWRVCVRGLFCGRRVGGLCTPRYNNIVTPGYCFLIWQVEQYPSLCPNWKIWKRTLWALTD